MTLPITVVIPCHNQANTLGRAIESALDAKETLIVDDASTDNTVGVCNFWVQNHSDKIWYFESGNDFPSGVCNARNLGITEAIQDLICCLDADDVLLPNALQAMYDVWQEGTLVYGGFIQDGIEHQAPPIEFIDRKSVTHATILFSKADWQRVGGYPIRYNVGQEDYAFHLMLHKAGVKSTRLDIPLYIKDTSADSRTKQVEKYHSVIREMMRIDNLI